MTTRVGAVVFACIAVCFGLSGRLLAQAKEDVVFDRLRSLVGEWDGTYVWSGAKNDFGRMGATYYLTGRGSALVEDLTADGAPVMTSVYHRDVTDIRVSHFCGAQNQPN